MESINSLIKKYVNSSCEISDITRFLIAVEKHTIYHEFKNNAENKIQYLKHPVMNQLQLYIFDTIYQKHLEQFTYSHNYIIKLLPADEITYEKDMCRYEIINVSEPTKKELPV